MIGRRVPAPGGDPTSVRLAHAQAEIAALTAQRDQLVAEIDTRLSRPGRTGQHSDDLLDLRLMALRPLRP